METLRTIREVFARNLRAMRGSRSKETLADAAGVPFPSYRDMEKGVLPKKWENVEALARFYRVSETRFFQDPDLASTPNLEQIEKLLKFALKSDVFHKTAAAALIAAIRDELEPPQ